MNKLICILLLAVCFMSPSYGGDEIIIDEQGNSGDKLVVKLVCLNNLAFLFSYSKRAYTFDGPPMVTQIYVGGVNQDFPPQPKTCGK